MLLTIFIVTVIGGAFRAAFAVRKSKHDTAEAQPQANAPTGPKARQSRGHA